MANMSYCRFENTYHDLMDCYNNMNDELSEREENFKELMLALCREIVSEYGDNDALFDHD